MSTGIELLHALKKKDDYLKYRKYIKETAIDEHVEEVLKGMSEYFDVFPTINEIKWSEFGTWFTTVHKRALPEEEQKIYTLLFSNLSTVTTTPVVTTIVDHFIKMDAVTRALDGLMKIADGDNKTQVIDIKSILDDYLSSTSSSEDAMELTEHDLTKLLDAVIRTGGFEWNLEDLNRSVGPVRRKDLVVVGARPETGKTSFICNEIAHMIAQPASMLRPAIFFNNEEEEKKIRLRLYTTCLNKDVTELMKNEKQAQADYAKAIGGLDRIKIVGKGGLSTRDVEYYVKKYNPAIIAINVMHKLKGFDKIKHDVERLGKLYNWARELAKEHDCLVILVAQADASAEGQQWIHMHQLYGSKTELQGEADVIITIGKVHDAKYKDVRYIHVPKNKMPPGPRTDPQLKHGYHEVKFENETGVFKSIVYKSRSNK